MRVVVQRVKSASVTVDGKVVSSIGRGILCLTGLRRDDDETDLKWMLGKILGLRLWEDESGSMWKRCVADSPKLEVLLVSQFTLYGQFVKGTKPDLHRAMPPTQAKDLYAKFVEMVSEAHGADLVKNGEFGAMMQVALVNDGPTTFTLDTPDKTPSKPIPASKSAPKAAPERKARKEGSDPAVLLKRAEKKLAKVQGLRQKLEKGEMDTPNPEQMAKLASEAELIAEVEQLKLEISKASET